MTDHRVRVLAIEGDPERVQLLEEAFAEMADRRFARPAYPSCERDYALDWLEGLYRMRDRRPDAVLLNISQEGTAALPAFLALRNANAGVALVLLCSREDEQLALSLLRQGAQDYLILDEIDCDPLARALRSAIERSRLQMARQSVALVDDLTGLYNDRGLVRVAERDLRIAGRLGLRPWLVTVRLDGQPGQTVDLDLQRLDLAERLSDLASGTEVVARFRDDAFVILGMAASDREASAESERTARAIAAGCAAHHLPVSVVPEGLFSLDTGALEALCGSVGAEDSAARNVS